ncbi:MAG TPA: STAS domain-containing protein, partial [Gammaproteobacteria bacterium]|nr:STAS domain-containing protein [Gammaproteobacteria bacterium]
RIETGDTGGVKVVGQLTFATVPAMVNALHDRIRDADGTLEIELSGVTHSDSAGLALLVEWLRQARRRQVALRFSRVPPQMREIAHVTSLERILALDGGPET